MSFGRKAQVQAISLVLISGIVITLAGAAYMWGKPLIEKRSTITDVAAAESFVIQLDKEIIDVTRNGGEKGLSIPNLRGSSISIDAQDNSITYRFIIDQPMLTVGQRTVPIPIETTSIDPIGVYGESPRIITLEASKDQSRFIMLLKLKYRELDVDSPPKKGYKIVLLPSGTSGVEKITVSNGGMETLSGGAANGGDLVMTMVTADLS